MNLYKIWTGHYVENTNRSGQLYYNKLNKKEVKKQNKTIIMYRFIKNQSPGH